LRIRSYKFGSRLGKLNPNPNFDPNPKPISIFNPIPSSSTNPNFNPNPNPNPRYLALIVKMFEGFGSVDRTEYFGSFRVDLVVSLFARVLDVNNFELVLNCMTAKEVGCVYARLGWLKLYNPMKPEGSYVLDLRVNEERQVAKTLIALAVHEPGDNWISCGFRWDSDVEPVPGWTLTKPWLTAGWG
jgi:hypothetical protein